MRVPAAQHEPPQPILSAQVPPAIATRVRELARAADRTVSAEIRRALAAHVAREEARKG